MFVITVNIKSYPGFLKKAYKNANALKTNRRVFNGLRLKRPKIRMKSN
jgi:hypothetical protein